MYYEMAKIGKKLVDKGLVELQFGNMSLRKEKKMLITRSGVQLDDISMDSVVEIDIERSSESDSIASSETIVHRAIYKNTAVSAIIHAHPMFAVIESKLVENDTIVPVNIEGEHFLGNIPVVRGAPGSIELAESIGSALVGHKGVIVSGHGTFAIGETLKEAYFNTALMEQSCKMKYFLDLAKKI